jgi:hypothetical protein
MGRNKVTTSPLCKPVPGLSNDDIYMMVMLYQYQKVSIDKLARRFGITSGQVRNIISRRSIGGCCG